MYLSNGNTAGMRRDGGEPYSALLQEPEHDYEVDPKAEQLMSAANHHICFCTSSSSAFEQQIASHLC